MYPMWAQSTQGNMQLLTLIDEDVAYAASLGFATVATNNGHNGTSGLVILRSCSFLLLY
jgi:hypothetical protein